MYAAVTLKCVADTLSFETQNHCRLAFRMSKYTPNFLQRHKSSAETQAAACESCAGGHCASRL
jgi:hypothetical protein